MLLKEWIRHFGIRGILFDLDGTVLDTPKTFKNAVANYISFVTNLNPDLKKDQVGETLKKVDDELRTTFAVSPKRWPFVATTLAEIYGERTRKAFVGGLPILMDIYQTAPDPLPGGLATLATFRQATDNLGVITNASEEWTDLKLRVSGISQIFKHKIIVPETTLKKKEHWQSGVKRINCLPHEVLAIGDDLERDIGPAHEAGIRYKIHILNGSPYWRGREAGVLPPETIQINGIGKVVETLIGTL